MLQPEDAEVIQHANAFMSYHQLHFVPTGKEIINHYETLKEKHRKSSFWEIIEFPVNMKTILIGLRRRHLGRAPPERGESWGIGPLVGHIQRNWNDPDFRLAPLYKWIPKAREYIETDEALSLKKLTFDLKWECMDQLSMGVDFNFDTVLAYVFKWDLIERWLSYNVDDAKVRFEELLTEAMNEQDRLFD